MRRRPLLGGLPYLCWILVGCVVPVQDLVVKSEQLLLPVGDYRDISWLKSEQFAVSYADWPDDRPDDWLDNLPNNPNFYDYEIAMLDLLDSSVLSASILKVPEPEESCSTVWKLDVERLPDAKLGIARLCNFWKGGYIAFFEEIIAYDIKEGRFDVISRSPLGEDIVSFSFAPDLSSSLQTFDRSGGLVSKLVLVDKFGEVIPLFDTYRRASNGSFSPTGKAFAFLGNERVARFDWYPEQWNVAGQLAHPWNLYVMDSAARKPRTVLRVRHGRDAKWSPVGPYVAFRGEIKGSDGVWIVYLETNKVYRVWRESTPFDWSPDGQRIVLLDETATDAGEHPPAKLVLLTLSLPLETP